MKEKNIRAKLSLTVLGSATTASSLVGDFISAVVLHRHRRASDGGQHSSVCSAHNQRPAFISWQPKFERGSL